MPTARHPRAGRSARSRPDRIRVASVPAAHPYVQHLAPVHENRELPRVVRLADPDPRNPSRVTLSRWWPPVMLEPSWVRRHADEFDVYHVHFGFDEREPAQLAELVDTLRELGKPIVHTVHDLRAFHQRDRTRHDSRLDVLVPAADALITLTSGAADEIRQRWGREAVVLPHPHVVDLTTMERLRRRRQTPAHQHRPFTVGLRVSKPAPGDDPFMVLPALVRAVRALPSAVLQVDAHPDVLIGGGRLGTALDRHVDRSDHRVRVRSREFFSDAQLWDYLAGLDVSVLPYRYGTHSSWLEACRDVGTAVVAPSSGYFGHQATIFGFEVDDRELDEDSLATAVRRAYDECPIAPVPVDDRLEQRQRIAEIHARIYLDVLTGESPMGGYGAGEQEET
jgi:beta-1,4-mannosyltransferase